MYDYDCDTTLYTTITPVLVKVHKIVCGTGVCTVRWNGEMEHIFRISSKICAGNEIMWEFQEMVKLIKCNFSAFCKIMTARYRNRNAKSAPFMSPKTFRKIFFSWASYQLIDFREPCPWCGESPKVLACDGTKIGISMQKVNILPIKASPCDTADIVTSPNRRFDRCFLPYPEVIASSSSRKDIETKIRDARQHMKLIMHKSDGFIEQEKMTKEQLSERNKNLMEVFPETCKPLLNRLFALNLTEEQRKACTRMFYLLSFDSPLSTIIPGSILSDYQAMVQGIETGVMGSSMQFLKICSRVNPNLGSFIEAFTYENSFDRDAFAFLKHIAEQLQIFQSKNVPPVEVNKIREYNPPKYGHAYYFTSSGEQIRTPRYFTIDKESKSTKNHDDTSTTSKCRKKYPSVALKGTSFMFLWFCPQHGHCYGFHIIDGSEGRKDAANSLVAYLKVAPQVIFYDFACNLEEYCLNRESGYFWNTKFYHDLFHGYTHSCSPAYNSKFLCGVRGVNTSICEQFNSYLQCIKASAKHMSQINFMFFAQYMISLWNKSKKQSFEKKLRFAASSI